MNKDNAHLFLPLVQALADGKTIQYMENGIWKDMFGDSIAFGNHFEHYRIKPEPREWDMWVGKDGILFHHTSYHRNGDEKPVRVREILD